MSEQAEEGSRGQEQDERVKRLRPQATDPPPDVLELIGFRGLDPNPEYARLYLNRALTYYVRFRREDAQFEAIPRGQHPIPEEDVTAVTLRREARVEYVRSRRLDEVDDQFDLDLRISSDGGTDWGVPQLLTNGTTTMLTTIIITMPTTIPTTISPSAVCYSLGQRCPSVQRTCYCIDPLRH